MKQVWGMAKQSIFLCGFMGCGKTTVGKLLAKRLKMRFVDMDKYIVKKEGKNISTIFEENGEEYFRQLETKAIAELSKISAVIATGGGAMLREQNAEIAEKNGKVVFLNVKFEVCYRRIKGDVRRPIAANSTKEELLALYQKRYPIYEANSSMTFDANIPAAAAARELAKIFTKPKTESAIKAK